MEQSFPGATADSATARVVFIAPGGEKGTAAGNKKSIEKAVAGLGDGTQVASAVDPFRARTVSEDGTTAFATVTYKVGANDLTDASHSHLERTIDRARDSGLTVEAGGTALAAEGGPGGAAEVIGVAIAAVVLLITFDSHQGAARRRLGPVVWIRPQEIDGAVQRR
ncbi:putative membrane protein YdfJ with MMPL/SSD domain [Streptomyces luteogriseus]|nr:putative membrane protein YdfJ with MMPL/SSD domain [Streptomyces luteogriseus]